MKRIPPILLLAFNRPETTKRVLATLRKLKPYRIFVAIDGPRQKIKGEKMLCDEVKSLVLDSIDWECDLKTLFREENLGCGKAVSSAITWFFDHVESGIILEDDCLPDPSFFWFCQELLEYYESDERVMHIGGNNFQEPNFSIEYSYYFSLYNHIWGWATWKRAWEKYDYELRDLESFLNSRKFKDLFQREEEVNFWKETFRSSTSIDTWDFQWLFAIWKSSGLCIHPSVNLVSNIGFGEGATHTTEVNHFANLPSYEISNIEHPDKIERNLAADTNTFDYVFNPITEKTASSPQKMIDKVKSVLKNTKNKIFPRNPNIHEEDPYSYLLDIPRYQSEEIELFGKSFTIADGMSFYYSYKEIFQDNIYKFQADGDTPVIFDCGSNYGTSIVYFKQLYPNCDLISFEADPNIFLHLERNVKAFGLDRVKLNPYALFDKEDFIEFNVEGADGGSLFDNNSTNSIKVETKTLSSYLREYDSVDFLKMDIEGAELAVFQEAGNHLGSVKRMFIEYHSFRNRKQELQELLSILSDNGFRYYIQTQFSSRNPFLNIEFQNGMDLQLNISAVK